MLQFTDLGHTKHFINLNNVNNVVYRQQNGTHLLTFHMLGQHFVIATVDIRTLERVFNELSNEVICEI